MLELYDALFDEDKGFYKEAIATQFDLVDPDCLILDYVVIHPRLRGPNLGLLALLRTIELLRHGCGLTVCDPTPLSEHAPALLKIQLSWAPPHPTCEESDVAREKLGAYVERLGFRPIAGTENYGLPQGASTPTLD